MPNDPLDLLEELVDVSIKTEKLIPGQTPLRDENLSLGGREKSLYKNTVQGMPIDWKAWEAAPSTRKNFYYVSPDKVPTVIKRQYKNYFKNPAKYRLSEDSTLEDVIKKFDQEHPENKIKLLQQNGIDLKQKIKDVKGSLDLSMLNPFVVKEAQATEGDSMDLLNGYVGGNKTDDSMDLLNGYEGVTKTSTPMETLNNDQEEKDILKGAIPRVLTLAEKTAGDIVFAPWGGAKGGLDFTEKISKKLGVSPMDQKRREEILNITPKNAFEHGISAVTQFLAFGQVFKGLHGVFGLGKQGLSTAQQVLRSAGVGGIFGALPKASPEDRAMNAITSAVTFGGITAGGIGLQRQLSKISQKQLQRSLLKVKETVDSIEMGLKTESQYSQADVFKKILGELPAKDRNIAMNVLRGKYNMPQAQYKNWYAKNIGDPLYKNIISKLEKYTPDAIKEKLIYRFGSPEHLTDLYESRNVNLQRWNELALRSGRLMTDGVSSAESKIMLRALQQPIQLDLLKNVRPDLAGRTLEVRNLIDMASRELSDEMARKASLTNRQIISKNADDLANTIKSNIGEYVKRTYEMPKQESFLSGYRNIRERKIFERAKVAREIYEEKMNKSISGFTKKYNSLSSVKNIQGIGKIAESRLANRGVKNVEDLVSMPTENLTNILMLEETTVIKGDVKKALALIERIDSERANLVNIYKLRGISGGASDVRVTGGLTAEQFNKRTQPVTAQLKLEGDLKRRFEILNKTRERLMKVVKDRAANNYDKYLAKAEGIKEEAKQLASRRRHWINKINEYNNLLVNPQKPIDIPYEVRKRLKVIETGGYPVARSIKDSGYKLENARFFNEIASDARLSSNNPVMAKNGWERLADTESMGALRGMWVHPAVNKDVNAIQRILSDQDRTYNKLLSLWKAGKVTLNPATHGRNILSNTILMEFSGVPSHRVPDLLSASLDDIRGNSLLYKELKKLGLGYGTFTKTEIESLINIYQSNSSIGQMLASAKDVLAPFKKLNNLYELEEELFKVAKVRHLLEQGFTVSNAFREAQKWLFNYNAIPEFIRNIRNAPLGSPFITFQYKALPRIFEALIKNPLDVAKYPILFGALEKYAINKFNLSDMDVQVIKKNKPLTYILPFTDSAGQLRLYDLQYTLPYGQFFEFGERGPVAALGFGNNPLFSVPYNLFITNRDPYTGREIVDKNSNLYRQFKEQMKFIGNQLLPPLTPYIGYSANQIGKSIQGIPLNKYGDRPDYILEVLGAVTGLKTKPVNIPTAYMQAVKEIEYIKRNAESQARSVMKDQSLTESQRMKRFEEIYSDMIRVIIDRSKVFNQKIEMIKE